MSTNYQLFPIYHDGVTPGWSSTPMNQQLELFESPFSKLEQKQARDFMAAQYYCNGTLEYDDTIDYLKLVRLAVEAEQARETEMLLAGPTGSGNPNIGSVTYNTQALVEITVIGDQLVEVDTDVWLTTNYMPSGKVWLEPGKVYECPKHGDEAVEFLYGMDDVFITAATLADLIRRGLISIKQK